jgi:hypothetical protein
MAEGEDQKLARRYQKDLPADRTNFANAWKLLESYSHIPPSEIDAHVIAVVSRILPVTHPTLPLANRPRSVKNPLLSSLMAALAAGATWISTSPLRQSTPTSSLVSRPARSCSTSAVASGTSSVSSLLTEPRLRTLRVLTCGPSSSSSATSSSATKTPSARSSSRAMPWTLPIQA